MTVKQTTRPPRLGRYELCELLGAGGMSEVYAAVHRGLQKRVAVKILRAGLRNDRDAVARFLREGECAARVSHPHVVDVADVGVEQGVPYLAMELLEGETLDERLIRGGPMSLTDALDLFLPILDAVAAIHDAGVLHRDIKPANVVLARALDGTLCPKLVDFGVATVRERRAVTGRIGPIGTPQYMSPEQARGERALDATSDQYSLASMLFEMLTGRAPFGEGAVGSVLQAVGRGAFPQLRTHLPHVPVRFEQVLLQAAAPDAAARFPSVLAFAEALLGFARPATRARFLERLGAVQRQRYLARAARRADPWPRPNAPLRPSFARRLATLGVGLVAMSAGLAVGMAQTTAAALPGRAVLAAFAVPEDAAEGERAGPPRVLLQGSRVHPAAATVLALQPAHATARLDGVPFGSGVLAVPRFEDQALHELRVQAPGYVTRVLLFRGAPPDGAIVLGRP